jgi:hypothetical protein
LRQQETLHLCNQDIDKNKDDLIKDERAETPLNILTGTLKTD